MMKNKIYPYFAIVIISMMALSCDLFSGKSNKLDIKDIESIEELQDTIKKILVAQDTLYAGLVNKIDSMAIALKTTDSNFKALEQQVIAIKKPTHIWKYITFGCVITILLILGSVFYLFRTVADKRKVKEYIKRHALNEEQVKELLRKIDIQDLKKKLDHISSTSATSKKASTTTNSSEIFELRRRIKTLEDQFSKSSMHNTSSQSKDNFMPSVSYDRTGYANTNSKNYFLDISDTKQEASVYEIKFQSDTTGIFDIISLDKIKSRNDWQDVIETQGDCLMQEANRYERLDYGTCKKVESSSPTWEVTKKLKIRIHK